MRKARNCVRLVPNFISRMPRPPHSPLIRFYAALVFCAFSLVTARSQVAATPAPSEAVSYEGQPVTAVDLVANPFLDVSRFKALITQPAEQPYSDEKVRASIEALKKTGSFSNVTTTVTPEANGLRLTFVMEPAYYVGVLQFPEAVRKFTYTRLLQVANFPDQSAFDRERLPEVESALRSYFAQNGYFQSRIHTEVQLDNTNRLANLIFHVDLGKQAKIGKVLLTAKPAADDAALLHSIQSLRAKLTGASLKPGKTYTPDRVKAATALLKKHLASKQRLASKVTVDPPKYDPETNRVTLAFMVEEGPVVSISTTGAKLAVVPFVATRRLKKLVPVYSEGSIDRELVAEGRQNLLDFFQQKGYFDAKVDTKYQRTPEKISLVYVIDKGRKHKVNDVVVHGNTHLSSGFLLAHVAVAKHKFLSTGKYSDKLVKQSVSNIEALYRDEGFEKVKVTPQVIDKDPIVDVAFNVEEGPQTLVENLDVRGNDKLGLNAITPSGGFAQRSGAPFSPRKVAVDRSEILAKYLDLGYLSAELTPQIQRVPGDAQRVIITYSIQEGQQVKISNVVYDGQQRTQTKLIAKTVNLEPEKPLSQTALLAGESKLYDLGIFDWASVGPRRPINTQQDEEAVIKVHEAKRNTLTYGFGMEVTRRGGSLPTGTVAVPGLPPVAIDTSPFVSSEATFVSPRGSIGFIRRNLRGRAETGSVSLLLSRLDQRAVSTYTDPHFRGTDWRSLFSLSAERTSQNPLFTAQLVNGSFQVERTLDPQRTTTLQLRYSLDRTDLSNLIVPQLVQPQDMNVRLSTLAASLIKDTRDKPLDAHRGSYKTIDLGITPSALGSSTNFSRLVAQYATYRAVRKDTVWANSIRLGLAVPFANDLVPTSERFFAGGGNTLRGYPLNGAGPQRTVPVCTNPADTSTCSNITVPLGGNQLFILNSELRFPLGIINNLGGVAFYDGGNVYSNVSFAQFVDNYSSSVGLGLRYSTPVGPVRIDVGRALNPITGISPWQYFITLGQAF